MLYFDAAQRHTRHQRAARLVDVSHAFGGGKDSKKLLRDLQKN